ncbi:hypothetical protein KHM83_15160 [Fusibacter paucivorans]|uniref:Uncharacterized protein n=1 Tax=Fusibacter paucivorans TaxID=76009 RepID=A0ABS5PS80_9FIRM|nr:hypothetical protein [Fusibacter paucivorans]MBS7528023.1 hypothetical protein [Fusibacter paucivorans]
MFIISFIIGLIIVVSSIFMLRRELNTAVRTRSQLIEQAGIYNQDDLFKMLEDLQLSINEMNSAFYEIIGEIEGNISLHEKTISDIETKMARYEAAELAVTQAQSQVKRELSDNLKRMHQMQETSRDLSDSSDQGKKPEKVTTEVIDSAQTKRQYEAVRDETANDSGEDTMAQITTLRSQGYSLTEIAKMLGMGMGEIQLLINMNLKK